MCEFDDKGVVINHSYADYTCPKCNTSLCWECNSGDITYCDKCGVAIKRR
jgi:ribosomal protein L37AE/L43A